MTQNVLTVSAGGIITEAPNAAADDALVLHKAGTESITGTKTFTYDAANSLVFIEGANGAALVTNGIVGNAHGGSIASPGATVSGSMLVGLLARGHDGTSLVTANKAIIGIVATETWTSTANGNRFRVATTATGTTTRADRLIIDEISAAFSVPIGQTPVAVASLPTGATGMRAFVNNALAPVFGAAVTGGGAVTVPVFHDGVSWKVG